MFVGRPAARGAAGRDRPASASRRGASIALDHRGAARRALDRPKSIGVHAIFGAFLLGAVIPHDSRLARALISSLEDLVTILLLPAFFAFTGMRTEIGLVTGAGPAGSSAG